MRDARLAKHSLLTKFTSQVLIFSLLLTMIPVGSFAQDPAKKADPKTAPATSPSASAATPNTGNPENAAEADAAKRANESSQRQNTTSGPPLANANERGPVRRAFAFAGDTARDLWISVPGSVLFGILAMSFHLVRRASSYSDEFTRGLQELERGNEYNIERRAFELMEPAEQRTLLAEIQGRALQLSEADWHLLRDRLNGKPPPGTSPQIIGPEVKRDTYPSRLVSDIESARATAAGEGPRYPPASAPGAMEQIGQLLSERLGTNKYHTMMRNWDVTLAEQYGIIKEEIFKLNENVYAEVMERLPVEVQREINEIRRARNIRAPAIGGPEQAGQAAERMKTAFGEIHTALEGKRAIAVTLAERFEEMLGLPKGRLSSRFPAPDKLLTECEHLGESVARMISPAEFDKALEIERKHIAAEANKDNMKEQPLAKEREFQAKMDKKIATATTLYQRKIKVRWWNFAKGRFGRYTRVSWPYVVSFMVVSAGMMFARAATLHDASVAKASQADENEDQKRRRYDAAIREGLENIAKSLDPSNKDVIPFYTQLNQNLFRFAHHAIFAWNGVAYQYESGPRRFPFHCPLADGDEDTNDNIALAFSKTAQILRGQPIFEDGDYNETFFRLFWVNLWPLVRPLSDELKTIPEAYVLGHTYEDADHKFHGKKAGDLSIQNAKEECRMPPLNEGDKTPDPCLAVQLAERMRNTYSVSLKTQEDLHIYREAMAAFEPSTRERIRRELRTKLDPVSFRVIEADLAKAEERAKRKADDEKMLQDRRNAEIEAQKKAAPASPPATTPPAGTPAAAPVTPPPPGTPPKTAFIDEDDSMPPAMAPLDRREIEEMYTRSYEAGFEEAQTLTQ